MAADSHRRQDLARANRRGCGGEDLVTALVRLTLDDGWAPYRPAIQRWETATRLAPEPTVLNGQRKPRMNPAFPEWMMGWPDGWVTDVRISRAEQLWVIGNGVCPQQALAALAALMEDYSVVDVVADR